MKKRIIPILYLVCLYIFCIFSAIATEQINVNFLYFVIALGVINMIYPFIMLINKEDSRNLFFWDMLIKLFIIPIDIIVFIMGVGGTILVFIFGGWMLGILAFLVNSFLLLSSSMYGVCGIIKAATEKKITVKTVVFNTIFHFCFCLDVISSIVMYLKVRKKEKALN